MAPVAAGISVISTVAGIIDHNNQVSRQNRAISTQQDAQRRAQQIRLQQIEFQKRVADQQFQLETLQNQFESKIQEGNLAIQLQQNRAQIAQQMGAMADAAGDNELQRILGEYKALDTKFKSIQAASQAEIQSYNEASQGWTELANKNLQIKQALQDGNINLASALAQQLARQEQDKAAGTYGGVDTSRSNKALKDAQASRQEFEAAMNMLQTGQVSQELVQSVLRSTEFQEMLKEMGLLQSEMEMSQVNRDAARNAGIIQSNTGLLETQYVGNDRAIRGAMDLLPLQSAIKQNQSNINYMTQGQGFDSEAALVRANANATIAQLEASRPQKYGLLSSLAAVGGAAMPLFSLLTPKTPVQQQTTQGMPTMSMNFDSPNRISNYVA